MIHLRLSGGLGNQLYQLAAVALLSKSQLRKVVVHIGGLNQYKTPRKPDSLDLVTKNDWIAADVNDETLCRWLSITARAGRLMPIVGVNDRNFWNSLSRAPSCTLLFADGYFQRGWTQDAFTKALSLMTIKEVSVDTANRVDNGEVLIHIRGGDFLRIPYFQVVDSSYYVAAVLNAIELGFNRFVVMTDDPCYATIICMKIREAIAGCSLRMLNDQTTALEDFDTIRATSARIIGNSTFSWWASALSSSNSITWAPRKFTANQERDFFLANEILPKK